MVSPYLKNIHEGKRTKVIRIILGILIPIVYTIIHIPPDVTIEQIISSIVIFLGITYFAICALKRFNIL